MKKHNVPIDRVVRHYDASRKNCPNCMSANNWAKWYVFKSSLTMKLKGVGKVDRKEIEQIVKEQLKGAVADEVAKIVPKMIMEAMSPSITGHEVEKGTWKYEGFNGLNEMLAKYDAPLINKDNLDDRATKAEVTSIVHRALLAVEKMK